MKINKSTGEICDWEWLMKHPNCGNCPRAKECDEYYEKMDRQRQVQQQKNRSKQYKVYEQERSQQIPSTKR